jgi:lysophospholipase L1-like esterase
MVPFLIVLLFAWAFALSSSPATELKVKVSIPTTSDFRALASQPSELPNPAATPRPNETDPRWMPRHLAKLKAIREQPVDVIFIGDSITQNLELDGPQPWKQFKPVWDKYYGTLNALNLGFDGDTTANVLWRLEHGEIDDLQPKVIVLEIGTNDTGRMHWSAQQTVAGIDAIVQLLHERMPVAKIVVLGILPCALFSAAINSQVNDSLSNNYQKSEFVVYEDFTDVFMRDGKLDRQLYVEGLTSATSKALHPSPEGQERMAKTLQPVLLKLMSDNFDPVHPN